MNNKNAFQYDAYRPLVDRGVCQGGCPGARPLTQRRTAPCGQTDTCENITLPPKLRLRAIKKEF